MFGEKMQERDGSISGVKLPPIKTKAHIFDKVGDRHNNQVDEFVSSLQFEWLKRKWRDEG